MKRGQRLERLVRSAKLANTFGTVVTDDELGLEAQSGANIIDTAARDDGHGRRSSSCPRPSRPAG